MGPDDGAVNAQPVRFPTVKIGSARSKRDSPEPEPQAALGACSKHLMQGTKGARNEGDLGSRYVRDDGGGRVAPRTAHCYVVRLGAGSKLCCRLGCPSHWTRLPSLFFCEQAIAQDGELS